MTNTPRKGMPKVLDWSDERSVGNPIIVTLVQGWAFEPGEDERSAVHVRGAENVKAAEKMVRQAKPCSCQRCRGLLGDEGDPQSTDPLDIPDFLRAENREPAASSPSHSSSSASATNVADTRPLSPSERYAHGLPSAEAARALAAIEQDRRAAAEIEEATRTKSLTRFAARSERAKARRQPGNHPIPGSRWDTNTSRWVHPALEETTKTGGLLKQETTMSEKAKKAKKVSKAKKETNGAGRQTKVAAGAVADFRQVRAGTKRAEIVKLATSTENGRTIDKIAELAQLDRKTVLTHFYCMNRDCAFGYEVDEKDVVTMSFPGSKSAADAIKQAEAKAT